MKKKAIVWTLVLVAGIGAGPAAQGQFEPEPYQPNVIVVLIDDLGIEQLAVYDDQNHYAGPYPYAFTPNIDALAADGLRFNQARATPLCSPTRAELHSSRYGRHNGTGGIVGTDNASRSFCEYSVAPAPVLDNLPVMLQQSGYETGLFGKLHLHVENCDTCEETPPLGSVTGTGDRYALDVLGYDLWKGIARNPNSPPRPAKLSAADDPDGLWRFTSYSYYFWIEALQGMPSTRYLECGCPPCGSMPEPVVCPGDDPIGCSAGCNDPDDCYAGKYATLKQRKAVKTWVNNASEPYFALWSLNDVHGPYDWPPAWDPNFPKKAGHRLGDAPDDPVEYRNTRVRAKLEIVDFAIGQLMAAVDPTDTVVILLADNGTQAGHGVEDVETGEDAYPPGHPNFTDFCGVGPCPPYSMAPYETDHLKGSPYDGGVRVPLIVWGAGVTNNVGTTDALVDVVDVYETVLELSQAGGYTAPTPCRTDTDCNDPYPLPSDCRDGISFVGLMKGQDDADSHGRQYSHAAIFNPNSFPPDPELLVYDPNDPNDKPGKGAREYYIRRDPADGSLYKLVRFYQTVGGTDCYYEEFYELVSDPLETNALDPSGPLYQEKYNLTKDEFDCKFPPFLDLAECPSP